MKSIYWRLIERVSEKIYTLKQNRKHFAFNSINKFASIAILSVVLPVGLIEAPVDNGITEKQAKNIDQNYVSVSLSVDSSRVLASDFNLSEIKPGESAIERQAREKAEAEAKAKAEAEAKLREQRNIVSRDGRHYADPLNFQDIYERAESKYGVDAKLLKAIHYVETGWSGSTTKSSYAGATGPMQFMPGTWRKAGQDGNGDGTADIHNVEDAIFGAANYLRLSGYPDVKAALWSYNPSSSYYRKVTNLVSQL